MSTKPDETALRETNLQPVTYGKENYYRGITSDGRVVYVLAEVIEANRHLPAQELFDADEWREATGDGESCWYAACCELCQGEYRPLDGHYEADKYSYCQMCCSW